MSNFIINPYRFVAWWASNWLSNNLLSYYKLDSDATDAHWSNTGSTTNVTWNTSDFVLGTASASFNGTNSRFAPPDLWTDASDFSISLWFKIPTNDNVRHQLVAIHDTNSFANKLEIYVGNDSESDTIRCVMRNGAAWGTTFGGSTNYKDNTWHHCVVTRDTSAWFIEVFIDGSSVASQTDTAENNATLWPQYDLWCFLVSGTYYNPMNWLIDEVGFWHTILDSTKISDLYNSWSWLAYSSFTS